MRFQREVRTGSSTSSTGGSELAFHYCRCVSSAPYCCIAYQQHIALL